MKGRSENFFPAVSLRLSPTFRCGAAGNIHQRRHPTSTATTSRRFPTMEPLQQRHSICNGQCGRRFIRLCHVGHAGNFSQHRRRGPSFDRSVLASLWVVIQGSWLFPRLVVANQIVAIIISWTAVELVMMQVVRCIRMNACGLGTSGVPAWTAAGCCDVDEEAEINNPTVCSEGDDFRVGVDDCAGFVFVGGARWIVTSVSALFAVANGDWHENHHAKGGQTAHTSDDMATANEAPTQRIQSKNFSPPKAHSRLQALLFTLSLFTCMGRSNGWVSPVRRIANTGARRLPARDIQRPHNHFHGRLRHPFAFSTTTRHMALVPLPVEDLEELIVVGAPSGPQYASYWGRTSREKYNQLVESCIVAFIGTFFSYFLSFVVGGFVSTIIGTMFFFWAILSPDFKARQRNWEFLGGRPIIDPWMAKDLNSNHEGLFGSLLLGRVDDVCVVEDTGATEEYDLEDFYDYTPDKDENEQIAGTPYLLRLRISDDEGRELQVHARLLEEYLGIEPGMPATGIVLSTSKSFSSLAALTDIYIPDAGCFVGDYPYLNQVEMEALLAEDDDLWDILQSQAYGDIVGGEYLDKEEIIKDGDNVKDGSQRSKVSEKITVRRRRQR